MMPHTERGRTQWERLGSDVPGDVPGDPDQPEVPARLSEPPQEALPGPELFNLNMDP